MAFIVCVLAIAFGYALRKKSDLLKALSMLLQIGGLIGLAFCVLFAFLDWMYRGR